MRLMDGAAGRSDPGSGQHVVAWLDGTGQVVGPGLVQTIRVLEDDGMSLRTVHPKPTQNARTGTGLGSILPFGSVLRLGSAVRPPAALSPGH